MTKATTTAILMLACLLSLEIIPHMPFANVRATYVSNPISENTIWTIENSPYIITSNITVNSDTTLTVQPGVVVKFDGNFSLIVNGSLFAIGTDANRIIFTSNKLQPKPGDWNTIKFTGEDNTSFSLRYCVVEYALKGVTIQSGQNATIEKSEVSKNLNSGISAVGSVKLEIKESMIQRNGDGITGSGDVFSGLVATNNSILFNNRGVYVQANGTLSYVSGITLSGNNFTYNKYGIFLYSGKSPPDYSQRSYITNFVISDNFLAFSEYAIYMETRSWGSGYSLSEDNSYISDGIISNNTLHFNKNGIYIYSGGAWYRFAFNIEVSGNIVASGGIGMYINAHHFELVEFDLNLTGNVFSANSNGLQVFDTVKTKATQNSIAYNSYGILYSSTRGSTGNVANYNDIYGNYLYAMQVQNATVNAESNYWGNATGPYHKTNPGGTGNQVSGNGTDLDFTPFASEPFGRINERPVSAIQVNRRKLPLSQDLVIDASASSDDDHVQWYFFEFGDQTFTSWITLPRVTHVYSSPNVYEVKVVVLDNYGVRSQETASIVVNVTAGPVTLVALVSFNSTLVLQGARLSVKVKATDGDYPVPEASVNLSSSMGGTFSKVSGISDTEGYFNSIFIPPAVSTQTVVTITANITKTGYLSCEGQSEVMLMPLSRDRQGGIDLTQAASGIAVVAILALGTVAYLRMKKKARPRRALRERTTRKSAQTKVR